MIRFIPDTWLEAFLRPLAMALPDASIYVEFMAPDVRFLCLVAVALALGSYALAQRQRVRLSSVSAGLAFTVVAFAVWLWTSGNGRYFIPVLLLAGPLTIALVHRLPGTRGFKLATACLFVALQGFALYENSPWGWWGLVQWREPPFYPIELDQQARTEAATYVSITGMSRSLIAPRFPAQARWLNTASLPDALTGTREADMAQALLNSSSVIQLIVPSRPDHMTPDRMPSMALVKVMNDMLRGQRLALKSPLQCRLLPSGGIAGEALKAPASQDAERLARLGFWVCALDHHGSELPSDAAAVAPDERVIKAFAAVEAKCSRYFPPGQTSAARIEGGWVRGYPESDLRLYVMDDGQIHHRFWRALNLGVVGTVSQALTDTASLTCDRIAARSGLPWKREL